MCYSGMKYKGLSIGTSYFIRELCLFMKQPVSIRKMTASDIETVTHIYEERLHPDYISFSELADGKAERPGQLSNQAAAIFRRQLTAVIESERCGFFVAMMNDHVVGFALASLRKAQAGHEECWLDDIAVKSSWTKHGVGTALVQWVIDWGRQRHARHILLESGQNNTSAHHLFEHLGFQPLSTVFWHDLSSQTL